MANINAIGASFEKLADGWIFGRKDYKFTFKNTAELIGSTNPEKYDHIFQEKDGTVAHIEDIPQVPLTEGLISGGIVSWTGVGYVFDISASVSRMGGLIYNNDFNTVTLEPSDVTFDRDDTFIITPTQHDKKTGTPLITPVVPQAIPPFEVFLTSVRVNANSSSPSFGSINYIYRENIEWTGSTSHPASVDFNSLTNPYQLTKSIETANIPNGFYISMDYGSNLSTVDFDNVSMRLNLKNQLRTGYSLGFRLRDGSGNVVGLFSTLYVNINLIGSYQFVAVGMNTFGYNGVFRYIDLVFTRQKGPSIYAGFFVDEWKLDSTVVNPPIIVDGSKWSDVGPDIYRDSRVLIGATVFDDATAKFEILGRVSQVGLGACTYFGYEAGINDDLSGNVNTAFGYRALKAIIGASLGYQNSAFGAYAGLKTTEGYDNTFIGRSAGQENTEGYMNTVVGSAAFLYNLIGAANTAVGWGALITSLADHNSGFGFQALLQVTTGVQNTALGSRSLEDITTTSGNIGIGYLVGKFRSSMTNTILIGGSAVPSANGETNQIVIGHGAVGNGSNTTTIGNASTIKTFLKGKLQISPTLETAVGAVIPIGLDTSGNIVPASASPTNVTITTPTTASLNMAQEVDLKRYILQSNLTINFSADPASTASFSKTFVFKQDATGGRAVTWNITGTAVIWQGIVPPIISDLPNDITVITIMWTGVEYLGQKSCGFNV